MSDDVFGLRPVDFDDLERLLAWRNDPETRRQSKTDGLVERAGHEAWLRRVLADEAVRFRVAVLDGAPVGSVRANLEQGFWLLSWTVAPEARGRNVGYRMVRAMIDQLGAPVRAEIKPGNIASLRIAEKLGMHRLTDEDGMTVWSLSP